MLWDRQHRYAILIRVTGCISCLCFQSQSLWRGPIIFSHRLPHQWPPTWFGTGHWWVTDPSHLPAAELRALCRERASLGRPDAAARKSPSSTQGSTGMTLQEPGCMIGGTERWTGSSADVFMGDPSFGSCPRESFANPSFSSSVDLFGP